MSTSTPRPDSTGRQAGTPDAATASEAGAARRATGRGASSGRAIREEVAAEIERRGGLPQGDFRAALRVQMEAQAAVAARRPPKPKRSMFPRALPWTSPMTRLWPGTKVLCMLALTSLLLWLPRWPSIVIVAVLLALACRVARVPRTVVPRLPFIVWWALLWGGISSAVFGGLEVYVRTTAMGLTVLFATFVVLWTTRPDHLAPAFATLLAPLRLLRLPVDEWARTMSLSLRGLPTLTAEMTALNDSSRLRGGWQRRLAGGTSIWAKYRALFRELGDTVTAALSASERRATATGRAMTMRGGVPPVVRERVRLGLGDVVAFVLTTGAVATAVLLRDLGR